MKRIFMLIVAVAFLVSFTAPVAEASPADKNHQNNKAKIEKQLKFYDVKGHWAEKVLLAMTAKGYLQGYQDKSFKPSNNVTNLEAVVMIVRALGLEEEAKDAKLSAPVKHAKQIPSWAAGYIQVAYEEGILTERELASFNPNQKAKRVEVAQMIARALDLEKNANTKNQSVLKFLDLNDIPENFKGVVIVIVQTGIMQGNNNNCFLPNKPITRAEMAVLLDRIDGKTGVTGKNEASGKIKSVDDDAITIVKNGTDKEYDFSDDVTVYINGKAADIEDLDKGLFAKLILNSEGEVVFVNAEGTEAREIKGEITQIVLGKNAQFTIDNGTKEVTYKVTSDTEIEKDGKEIFLNELEIGWTVSVEAKNGVALEIYVHDEEDEDDEDEEEKYQGIIRKINTGNDAYISIKDKDGDRHTFDVDKHAEITLDGEDAALNDLRVGYEVEVVVIDDIAVEIKAESVEEKFAGEIVTITLTGQDTIIIETEDEEEFVFDVTDDTIIKLNGKTVEIDELEKGDQVKIIARKGEAVKIDAERDED